MKIVMISDTHEMHDQVKVPEGDLLIHCGDWTNRGDVMAITKFLSWFSAQPHQYKCFIAGNHELSLDFGAGSRKKSLAIIQSFLDKDNNFHYLENSGVNINGFNIYGSPATPFFYNWAFNYQRGKDITVEWSKIPNDTDILITHGPPYNILDLVDNGFSNIGRDNHQGCKDLADRIKNLKQLRLHCSGHLHTSGGMQMNLNNIIYVNAAICTEQYKPTNQPVVIAL